ncbi:Aluminum-activated malate transporter 12 [Hibiscus syriacus]|uniref:Aluminum-activated malate transporter 12 n=1 Tax=Hibiscus syriacus TaxID=106335 RepID=A0A6A2WFW7_HIBSY|nr:Aluminum-activated malate transporter 12 [Hibiscus syriacus]
MATRVHVGMETEMIGNGETEIVKNNWKTRFLEFSGNEEASRFVVANHLESWSRRSSKDDSRCQGWFVFDTGLSVVSDGAIVQRDRNECDLGRHDSGGSAGIHSRTVLAGSLAFLIEFIANKSGKVFRAVFIGTAVFLVGAAATYMRFFPYIKKNYDYGCNIPLDLQFDHRVKLPSREREDLHNSTVGKLEGLAKSIEACVNEYFNDSEIKENIEKSSEDPIYKGIVCKLGTEALEALLQISMAAVVKVGVVLRQFGYTVVALHGCLQTEIQAPRSVRALFKDPCIRLAGEVTKALMELANSIRNRRHCSPGILSDHLHEALQDLNTAIKSQPRLFLGSNNNQATNMLALAAAHAARQNKQEKDGQGHGVSLSSVKTDSSALMEWKNKRISEQTKENERKVLRPQLSKIAITSLEFSEALPFAAFASLLVEIVARLDNVIEEVEELGRIACYKEYDPEDDEIVVKCERPPVDVTKNQLPTHASD